MHTLDWGSTLCFSALHCISFQYLLSYDCVFLGCSLTYIYWLLRRQTCFFPSLSLEWLVARQVTQCCTKVDQTWAGESSTQVIESAEAETLIVTSDHDLHSWLSWNASLPFICLQFCVTNFHYGWRLCVLQMLWCCLTVRSVSPGEVSQWVKFCWRRCPLWWENQRPLCRMWTVVCWCSSGVWFRQKKQPVLGLSFAEGEVSQESFLRLLHCLNLPGTVKEECPWELIWTVFLVTELGWSTCVMY